MSDEQCPDRAGARRCAKRVGHGGEHSDWETVWGLAIPPSPPPCPSCEEIRRDPEARAVWAERMRVVMTETREQLLLARLAKAEEAMGKAASRINRGHFAWAYETLRAALAPHGTGT